MKQTLIFLLLALTAQGQQPQPAPPHIKQNRAYFNPGNTTPDSVKRRLNDTVRVNAVARDSAGTLRKPKQPKKP